jgi:hypothetical protein
MWCISSRTNSPACVLGDFPSRLSSSARLRVSFSGIAFPPLPDVMQREKVRDCLTEAGV